MLPSALPPHYTYTRGCIIILSVKCYQVTEWQLDHRLDQLGPLITGTRLSQTRKQRDRQMDATKCITSPLHLYTWLYNNTLCKMLSSDRVTTGPPIGPILAILEILHVSTIEFILAINNFRNISRTQYPSFRVPIKVSLNSLSILFNLELDIRIAIMWP